MDSSGDIFDSGSNMQLKQTDCIVAYIDILGTKSILSSDDESEVDRFVNKLSNMYRKTVGMDANTRVFSDNILIFDSYSDDNLNKIIDIAGQTQFQLLMKYRLASRGGITRGSLYYDDNFVLGKGLVDAYILESEKAVGPRIILDDDLSTDSSRVCRSPSDDYLMLNYIECSIGDTGQTPIYDQVSGHRSVLEELIEENRHNPDEKERMKILSKYREAVQYHNWCCDRRMFRELRIDDTMMHGGVTYGV